MTSHTQFYAQFDQHLAEKQTISLYDVQRILVSDDLAECKE